MILIIKSESNDSMVKGDLIKYPGRIKEFSIPDINDDNDLIVSDKSISYFEKLTGLVSPSNVISIYTNGLSKEILGVTIGYLMSAGVLNISDNEELQKKIDFLLDGKMPDENDKKIFLIKKILYLGSCQFKKFNSIVSELKFEDTIEDYILDALMMFYGVKPVLMGSESKFIKSISKVRGLWA